jgi:hypothetical protein
MLGIYYLIITIAEFLLQEMYQYLVAADGKDFDFR